MAAALEVKRKEKESPQSLVRRFTKAVQQSGILVRARERMFKDRNISEEKKKRAALRREELKAKYERLKKLGQIP
jgi:ribosomal protein S21